MNTILKLIAYIITIPLFITWLLFCAFLAILGGFLPKKDILINLDQVKQKDTICKILNNKGLLSDKEYSFETNEVAVLYDELTFHGYLFILNPIIFLLKYTSFLDDFISYLAYKWMALHHFKKEHKQKSKTFFSLLASVCVLIAQATGNFLYRF